MNRDLRLSEIPPDCRYFSAAELRAWARNRISADVSISEIARVLGWSESGTRYVLRGICSPTLENYCRALARTGEPFGSWLDPSILRK